ncbi:CapA family protein [Candidatus Gracilibacteria bacterium]|nr:CapA family protein [Candidatus Gracilibacteria bacterium]
MKQRIVFIKKKQDSFVLKKKAEKQKKNISRTEKGISVTIAFGGDIMLSRGVGSRNKEEGYDRIFKHFYPNKNIADDAVLFYNLESPFTKLQDNDIDQESFIFKANPKNIEILKKLKGNRKMVLSLANNHIRNGGGEGVDATMELLQEEEIFPVGVQKGEKTSIQTVMQSGKKLCFGAYSYDGGVTNMTDSEGNIQKYFVNPIQKNEIFADIQKMEQEQCDLKIISFHWGAEYRFEPTFQQQKFAHELIDAGVDIIAGGHSHILGKAEKYKGKMIYYSLGNFIFDQDWGKHQQGGSFDTIYDEKLEKDTVPTYIGNTFVHEYFFPDNGGLKLKNVKNIKHRINYGALEEY